jgi:hypothetical protein
MVIQRVEPEKRGNKGVLKLLLSVSFILLLAACSSHPVVETVTTDAGRESALPKDAQPIAKETNLPARDPDIEAIGDHIAEAITYLNTRRRDRREIALRALNLAETRINHALRDGNHAENVRTVLHSTLKDLDFAEHAVQRNSPDAIKQLAVINKNLDGIDSQ